MRATLVLATLTLTLAFAQTKLPPAASRKIDFEKDIQPILAQKCHSCHGDEAQQSGLRLDQRQAALRGGDYGPVIIPGDRAKSKLIHRVANGDGGLQMPPTGPLSDEEIGILPPGLIRAPISVSRSRRRRPPNRSIPSWLGLSPLSAPVTQKP